MEMERRGRIAEVEAGIAEFLFRHRRKVLVFFGLVTLLFLYGLTQRLSVRVILEELVPPAHPYVRLQREFFHLFGGVDTFLVEVRVKQGDVYNTAFLERLKRITDDIAYYPQVRRALVASITQRKMKGISYEGQDVIRVESLAYPEVPQTPAEVLRLKRHIETNELYRGVLVSRDGKAALIVGDMVENPDYAKFFAFLQRLKQREEKDGKVVLHMAGRPILYGWIYHYLPELRRLSIVSVGVILALLLLFFREIAGLTVPIVCAIITTIWGLGFCGLVGINFNPLMLVLPFLVGAPAVSHSVQITKRYLEQLYVTGGDKEEATKSTIQHMFMAALASIVTDAAGFSVLVMAKILMIQRVAVICSFWVVSIFLVVETVGPLLCYYLPVPTRLEREAPGVGRLDRFLMAVADWAFGRVGRWVVVGVILATFGAATYIAQTRLKVGDLHPGSPVLWPDSTYNRDVAEINARFDGAGCDPLALIVEGPKGTMEQPRVLRAVEDYTRFMKRQLPDLVAGTRSLVPIAKKMKMAMGRDDPKFEVIPDTYQEVGAYFFQFRAKGDPEDFFMYTDPDYRYGNVVVFLRNHMGDNVRRAVEATKAWVEAHQPQFEKVRFRYAAGLVGILAATNEEIEAAGWKTIVAISVVILAFCGIAFRSGLAAVILAFPLFVATMIAFAYMALVKIGMDVNTLPVASVGMGVGVDYGIYLLTRIREEYARSGNLREAVLTASGTTVKAIYFTAVILTAAVLTWRFTHIRFVAEMGLLLAFLLMFNCVSAMVFQPAVLSLLRPRFITKVREEG